MQFSKIRLLCLLAALFSALYGCSASDSAADGGTGADSGTIADTGSTTDDAGGADAGGSADAGAQWNVTVTVKAPDKSTPVNLGSIDKTTFNGTDAVRLIRVVEQAALAKPWDNVYNFIASDGFDIFSEKAEGNIAVLPVPLELEKGFLNFDGEDLVVGWDPALNFPKFMGAKMMAGGTIEVTPIPATVTMVHIGDVRATVDLSALPTQDIVDYKLPEDGAVKSVEFTAVLAAAAAVGPENYVYKMYGNDGWSNNDELLMPYENAQHAYVNLTTRRVMFAEEQWDTTGCCWRVRDTVLIIGIPK